MRRKPTTGDAGGVFKRSYDPENERRFRQGAYAAATGIAGVGALGYGVQGIRQTRGLIRNLPDLKEQSAPRKAPAKVKGAGGKFRPLTDAERAAAEATHADAVQRFHSTNQAAQTVRRLKGTKGMLITPKHGIASLAGLAGLGTAGALARHRHEERWD
jgi:hypothetical protein